MIGLGPVFTRRQHDLRIRVQVATTSCHPNDLMNLDGTTYFDGRPYRAGFFGRAGQNGSDPAHAFSPPTATMSPIRSPGNGDTRCAVDKGTAPSWAPYAPP